MRRRRAEKRKVLPDPKYKSELVSKFVNVIMLNGKRSIAETIFYNAVDKAAQKVDQTNPIQVVEKALQNARPLLQLKSRRVGGATYQIPVEVHEAKGITIAMRWINHSARDKKGRPMYEKLADELADAYKGTGTAVKRRDEVHRMAEANRAFSHYRW
jgi:small subunit ribosomal protein S7